jgi:hypothetical protein
MQGERAQLENRHVVVKIVATDALHLRHRVSCSSRDRRANVFDRPAA